MTASQQIPLGVHLNDEATFGNFFVTPGSANALVLEAVKGLSARSTADTFVYLWGISGLSHLLQAACHEAQERGYASQYLPLAEVAGFAPGELLEGLEHQGLLCLDGLESVLGRPDWDEALFHFYNRIRLQGSSLLVSANCPPREVKSSLPDLASRLAWGTTYRLEVLSDLEKQQALQQRAQFRGMEMNEEVARYILNHGSREPKQLFECLDRLDRRSLAEKRRLSIAFVKEVLGL
jgi:DnaA family protein